MVMICQCRKIDDTALTQAFETLRAMKYGGDIEDASELTPLLGDFDCGGCRRIFARAAENFNESGQIRIFRIPPTRNNGIEGLCSTAASRDYPAQGIPNLRMPAIDATV